MWRSGAATLRERRAGIGGGRRGAVIPAPAPGGSRSTVVRARVPEAGTSTECRRRRRQPVDLHGLPLPGRCRRAAGVRPRARRRPPPATGAGRRSRCGEAEQRLSASGGPGSVEGGGVRSSRHRCPEGREARAFGGESAPREVPPNVGFAGGGQVDPGGLPSPAVSPGPLALRREAGGGRNRDGCGETFPVLRRGAAPLRERRAGIGGGRREPVIAALALGGSRGGGVRRGIRRAGNPARCRCRRRGQVDPGGLSLPGGVAEPRVCGGEAGGGRGRWRVPGGVLGVGNGNDDPPRAAGRDRWRVAGGGHCSTSARRVARRGRSAVRPRSRKSHQVSGSPTADR